MAQKSKSSYCSCVFLDCASLVKDKLCSVTYFLLWGSLCSICWCLHVLSWFFQDAVLPSRHTNNAFIHTTDQNGMVSLTEKKTSQKMCTEAYPIIK